MKTLPVYNCTSGGVNPVTWGFFETVGMKMTRKFPMENILWYPGGSYKESKMVNSFCEVFQHTLPAHLFDLFLWMMGRKQFMVRLVQGGVIKLKLLIGFVLHTLKPYLNVNHFLTPLDTEDAQGLPGCGVFCYQ